MLYGVFSVCFQAMAPVVAEVEVPYEYHRSIIGKDGCNIRKLMDAWRVEINVPNPEAQSNIIKLSGRLKDIEVAKKGMEEEVAALDRRKEDRV